MDFYAVKARCFYRVAGGGLVAVHQRGKLLGEQRARRAGLDELGLPVSNQHGFGLGAQGRGRHRGLVGWLQAGVRNAAHMPQLHHHLAAGLVHGVGDALPAIKLLGAIQTRHVGIALGLVADGGGFADDQPGRGALGVVLGHERVGHGVGRSVACERRHHDAVGQRKLAHLDAVKE